MTEQKRGEIPGFQHIDELPWIPKEQNGVSLTGDPVDIGRGMTNEAKQALFDKQNPHLLGDDGGFDIPGLDANAVAEGGVDSDKDDGGCESGACKI